jgi:hypothetical protein
MESSCDRHSLGAEHFQAERKASEPDESFKRGSHRFGRPWLAANAQPVLKAISQAHCIAIRGFATSIGKQWK